MDNGGMSQFDSESLLWQADRDREKRTANRMSELRAENKKLRADLQECLVALIKIRNHRLDYDIVHPFIEEVLEKITGKKCEEVRDGK